MCSAITTSPGNSEDLPIFHYNFPLPDFEACIAEHMADIATVMAHELSKGKIAVHCHAGHGRTGTAIAACLMRTRGLTPRQAVELVRKYTSRILPKMDVRQYGNVPKPFFVGAIALLHKVTEEMLNLMSVGVTQRGQSWFAKRVAEGMNILNIERFLEDEADLVELVSFIDYFVSTAFFQLTNCGGTETLYRDYVWIARIMSKANSLEMG
ncbi:dual specificity phosphatase, catalytic domain protein [Ancylostoma duodenale]|uniref:Dual specificity phosphatase, catalytic domain protein n=1 Tax=Ancylostoma duodenale TaxID=51022 RepID=A0A0C2GK12_9BILA|nr:dual specificity phosphatase, catalytic domain protein [Ancylostoma duodenale]